METKEIRNYLDFYNSLEQIRLITPIWGKVLSIIEPEIKEDNKDNYLILYTIYFSLIDAGNICISLDKNNLQSKWASILDATKILIVSEDENADTSIIDLIKTKSNEVINDSLDELPNACVNKLFIKDDNYIYAKKYYDARIGIIKKVKELFVDKGQEKLFDFDKWVKEPKTENDAKFKLSKGQEDIVKKGFYNNIIVTGGPGTGKTTSIIFLLIALLEENMNYEIHLVAPSGKASSRMKDSILNNLNILKEDANQEIINKLKNLENSTIHRLLSIDHETNGFKYNANHQFSNNSIFVVDEASMIDTFLFDSLLQAIPNEARIFIMGDKDQLPSVECGAVFADLVKDNNLPNNCVVALTESQRFKKGSTIYNLADAINYGKPLDGLNVNFVDLPEKFIQEYVKDTYNIGYYTLNKENQVKVLKSALTQWGHHYYGNPKSESKPLETLQNMASNLILDEEKLKALFDETEKARILSAENCGVRGVKTINNTIRNLVIDKSQKTSIYNHYAGELMMVNKNNNRLDLYNGDSGILVTFKTNVEKDEDIGVPTLYFMVRKDTKILSKDIGGIDEIKDDIFSYKGFVFYPLRLIASDEIDLAYAITIHKSQGTDYKSILVILPILKGHPLLNKNMVYTAITRTKGNTYILSTLDILKESQKPGVERDTNIILN